MTRGSDRPLTVALPRGRLLTGAIDRLESAGIVPPRFHASDLTEERDGVRYLKVRALDVPVLVARGMADAGVAGLDALAERSPGLVPTLDLGYGRCRVSLAGVRGSRPEDGEPLIVATRYVRIVRRYLAKRRMRTGVGGRVVPLLGAVELAPEIGLAPFVVDVVETGRSLRAHGLWEVDVLLGSVACLVVGPQGHDKARPLVEKLARNAEEVRPWTGAANG